MKFISSKKDIIILGAYILFFLVLWKAAPLGIMPDSGAYMSMQPGREPVYPLFLLLFRVIFREKDTLVWMAASGELDSKKARSLLRTWPALHASTLVQSILAGISCYFLARAVIELFFSGEKPGGRTGLIKKLIISGVYALPLAPYVLTPLASASHMVLGRAVGTEGLAFPLFGFFTGALLLALFAPIGRGFDIRAFIPALGILLLLVLTRTQMLLYLPVWCLGVLGRRMAVYVAGTGDGIAAKTEYMTDVSADKGAWVRGLWKVLARAFVYIIACVIIFMGARSLINRSYTAAFNEGYTGASTAPYNMLTTLIYLSGEEDELYIEDEADRRLFAAMRREAAAGGLLAESAPAGILNRAYHYEDAYDTIGFEIQQPLMFEAVQEAGAGEGDALNMVIAAADRMRGELFPVLLPAYMGNYLCNAISGLVRSVAASGTIMGIYALIVYSISVVFMVYLWVVPRCRREALFILTALTLIGANAFATSIMIMCLSRYMIYNTPLFYMALAVSAYRCLDEL